MMWKIVLFYHKFWYVKVKFFFTINSDIEIEFCSIDPPFKSFFTVSLEYTYTSLTSSEEELPNFNPIIKIAWYLCWLNFLNILINLGLPFTWLLQIALELFYISGKKEYK